jgi:hypothetical protein
MIILHDWYVNRRELYRRRQLLQVPSLIWLPALPGIDDHHHCRAEVPAAADLFRYASPRLLRLHCKAPPSHAPLIEIFSCQIFEFSEGKGLL